MTGAATGRPGSGCASRPRAAPRIRTAQLQERPSSIQEVIAMPNSSDSSGVPAGRPDARDLFDLTGRLAVVTGGPRGLGLAMVVASLRAEGLKAAGCACHVGHWDDLEPLVERIYDDHGCVDVLVNNAGISP